MRLAAFNYNFNLSRSVREEAGPKYTYIVTCTQRVYVGSFAITEVILSYIDFLACARDNL